MHPLQASFDSLLLALKQIESVRAIGKTGGAALPTDGYSDIDLFVFCERIPALEVRAVHYSLFPQVVKVAEFGASEHPHWGLVDSVLIGEQEVYLMFFTQNAFSASIDAILRGERTEREENYFYPTGRLASIQGMHAFHDPEGYLSDMKTRLSVYPDSLKNAILSRCLPKIDDEEDFMRAIRRKDLLFYHATLDLALDRFLQAIFALNRTYFPSRKCSLEFIHGFANKPKDCEERLERVVELGASAESLMESYEAWQSLCRGMEKLA